MLWFLVKLACRISLMLFLYFWFYLMTFIWWFIVDHHTKVLRQPNRRIWSWLRYSGTTDFPVWEVERS